MTLLDENLNELLFADRRIRSRISFNAFSKEEIEQSIQYRFERQVIKYPSRIAASDREVVITYDALNRLANKIARAVAAESKRLGDRVALLFQHDATALAAMLGVLKAGRVYVPIDPSYPPNRMKYILEDSEASLIIANGLTFTRAHELSNKKNHILDIDKIGSDLSDENLNLPISPNEAAYIIYTSGSSGQPKGVVQTHGNLLHMIRNYTNDLGITDGDRLSLLPSFSFAASLMDIYGALLNGASVYPFSVKENGISKIADWLIGERITVYHSVPSLFRFFLSRLTEEKHFSDLRIVNLGGEPVRTRDIKLFKSHLKADCILVNSLACTEAGVFSQLFVDRESSITTNAVPVGYPTCDIEISLLDDEGRKVSVGQVGQIVVRSAYLSPAYWGTDASKRTAFSQVTDGTEQSVYATGDLGRQLSDGTLVHLGRADFQINIRGYRVEVAEIEDALEGLPEIEEAAVIGRQNFRGDIQLVAFLVLSKGMTLTVSLLKNYLRNKLPDYMMPSQFIFIDALPVNPNGKLDRNTLASRDIPSAEFYEAPCTPIERTLEEIWSKVLGLKQVGISEDFFKLGGDSLMATELFCSIESEYGKKVSPSVLLQAPTIRELATYIEHNQCLDPIPALVPIRVTGSRPILFCLPAITYDAIIFRDLAKYLDPEQPAYGIETHDDALQTSLEETVSNCVDAIRSVNPGGPFFLMGSSSGGVLALEIARKLLDMNMQVPFLAMLDSVCPNNQKSGGSPWKWLLSANFYKNLPYWSYYFLPFWLKYYGGTLLDLLHIRTREKATHMKVKRVIKWLDHHHYTPQYYPGRIILYRARGQGLFVLHFDKGWGRISDCLDIHLVPGNHRTMIKEPNVKSLADKINLELRNIVKTLNV